MAVVGGKRPYYNKVMAQLDTGHRVESDFDGTYDSHLHVHCTKMYTHIQEIDIDSHVTLHTHTHTTTHTRDIDRHVT